MKKHSLSVGGSLLGIVALLSMQYAVGQEGAPTASQAPDLAFKEVYNKIKSLRPKKLPWVEKLKKFNKVVDYLEKSRDCLSGTGCSKKQSYLANFALGAAISLGKELAYVGFKIVDGRVGLLDFIVTGLGYRYFVKEKVSLFRCLTFRGCSDQTKRFLMFNLGRVVGTISGNILAGLFMPKKSSEWQKKSLRRMLGLPAEEESGETEEEEGPFPAVESTPVEAPFVPSELMGQGDID